MTSPTLIWDVASGFLIGLIAMWCCWNIGTMLFKPNNDDFATRFSLVVSLFLIGGVGTCMIAFGIVHLPEVWLCWHGEICWL